MQSGSPNPKDQKTVDFLVNTASRKLKDKFSWVSPDLRIVPAVQIIRTMALEALKEVDFNNRSVITDYLY